MSGGYAQLKNKLNGINKTSKEKVKVSKVDQVLKARRRALSKLGIKANEFLEKWEALKRGEDKQKADGFIASLIATGYSHIEVQSLLNVGGSRVARLSKPGWAKKEKRPPPSHAANTDDIDAISKQIDTWNIQVIYGCTHNIEVEYLNMADSESKHASWKGLYKVYAAQRNNDKGRILSYNRWLDYVRFFRPNLKLTKTLAKSSCSRCYPDQNDNKQNQSRSPIKRCRKSQPRHIPQIRETRTSPSKSNNETESVNKKIYSCNKSNYSDVTNDAFTINTESTANWNTPVVLDHNNRQISRPIDELGLLTNPMSRTNDCGQYMHTPMMSASYQSTHISNAPEYFPPDHGYFSQNLCEFFPIGVGKIQYSPNATPDQTMCFKHYNENQIVLGRTMKDWLRFSVCYWHTFRGVGSDPFGSPTITRHWDNGSGSIENARQRLRAGFEFFSKLGVPYWTFHDRDIAPEGMTLAETNHNLDVVTDLALELQQQTGVRLLWNTCNLFTHPRYMNGAATSNDAHVFAYAAAQVKKSLDIAKKLGALNFVFWGGREGFQSLLNTDVITELDHLAKFFKMAVEYKSKIGFTGQFLIEPKPKEPLKHQYDYDAMTVVGFLEKTGLKRHFKINVEPNHTMLAGHDYCHDIHMSSQFGMLGSIDANTGSPDLGWDTDQFPSDIRNATLMLKVVIEQGGIQPGGLNFDCKLRRESTDVYDMFIAHIGAMDTLARGLKSAAKIVEDGIMHRSLKNRYLSFTCGIGKKIHDGTTNFEELEQYILEHGEPNRQSGKQEHFESMLNHYL